MLSECKEKFEDADMPHKMNELLHAVGLPIDIDAIPDSTGNSETTWTPSTPHPPLLL
jgi:hypothetical protein